VQTADPVTSLWVEPADPASQDLFYGPGGRRLVPGTDVAYQFRNEDTRGHSGGYDVDLTTDNNRIYRLKDSRGPVATWYVVQDVGAGLGGTLWTVGSRNNLRDFENQGFVTGARNGRVKFDYNAGHKGLLSGITPADVVWTCRLMARLTDSQLHDAFRAAGYPQDVADRYVRKIEQKIQEGLALATQSGDAG